MTPPLPRRLALLTVLALSTSCSNCGGKDGDLLVTTLSVYMENKDTTDVHLWVEGAEAEGVFRPNQIPLGAGSTVTPGGQRSWELKTYNPGFSLPVRVSAGRNGQLLGSAVETITFEQDDSGTWIHQNPMVIGKWSGTSLTTSRN